MNPSSSSSPSETMELILNHLLPTLLSASLSVKSFLSRWNSIRSSLSLLSSSLRNIHQHNHNDIANSLFIDILLRLHPLLLSLHSLSSRCGDASLSSGKLHLQSDLDIAASSLSLSLHDLRLLSASGLLRSPPATDAIVLPLPGPTASKSDLLLFLRDLFARLQIGAIDVKQKALESLLQLLLSCSDSAKISILISREDDLDLSSLIRLLDHSNHSAVRYSAAAAVAVLASASDVSRTAVFEQGALGPLLRLLESGSNAVKEQAAIAVEAITADPANAWAVAAYGGVPVLVSSCRPGGGSPAVQELAAGALKNVSTAEDLRIAMGEEGAVPVLIDLLADGTALAKKNSALCILSLASQGDNGVRMEIFQKGGLERLIGLVGEAAEPEMTEHALRAILALSDSAAVAKAISLMPDLFVQLADLIRIGHSSIQQVAASLLTVAIPSEQIRRSMAGCLPALVKILEYAKPAMAQEAAANALMILLAVRSNRKELTRDEKSMRRLVQMLDPRREEVCKRFLLLVVLVLTTSGSCRRKLADAGASQYLQKLVELDVPGAKKALQRITGNRLKNLFTMSWRE